MRNASDAGRLKATLETMLTDAFGVRVRGQEDLGRWLPVEERYQTRIGALGGQNCSLGQDTMLGNRAWDASAAIGLTIGPLTVAQFHDFEPGGASYEALTFMTFISWLAVILEGVHYRYVQGQTVGAGFDTIGALVGPLVMRGHEALEAN